MNRSPLATVVFGDDTISHSSPRVPPPPAPAEVQAERKRLAEAKRARKAARLAKGMRP